MGLLSILRKNKYKESEMRILVLGLDNAGKTTIVTRLKGLDTSKVAPTFGFDIFTMEIPKATINPSKAVSSRSFQPKDLVHDCYKLNLWDIGGQKTIRAYWRNYFECTDGIIFVIDSSDTTRLHDAKVELFALIGEYKLSGASLVILCNKQDLKSSLKVDQLAKVFSSLIKDSPAGSAPMQLEYIGLQWH
jgi:ADP-ribosylation factor-like protein 2